jgi:hypothetical protein
VEFGGKICEDAGVHTCVAFAKIEKRQIIRKKVAKDERFCRLTLKGFELRKEKKTLQVDNFTCRLYWYLAASIGTEV